MQSPPLLELMTSQIVAQCDAKLAESKAQAERTRQDARNRATKRRADLLAAVEREVAEMKRRSRERVEAETEMVILTTKDTVTDELLERVRGELKAKAAAPDFANVLDALLAELMPQAPANGVVLVPAAHEAHCREWLSSNGHGEVEVRVLPGLADGVAVQDAKQTFRVTNTLSARFQQLEPSLRKYCVAQLFGEGA